MGLRCKAFLITASVLALGAGIAGGNVANAGDSQALLLTDNPMGTPSTAGPGPDQTLYIFDMAISNSRGGLLPGSPWKIPIIWDAVDGAGSDTSDIMFVPQNTGAASLTIKSSDDTTGLYSGKVTVRNIDSGSEDVLLRQIIVDAADYETILQVVGQVGEAGAPNNVDIILKSYAPVPVPGMGDRSRVAELVIDTDEFHANVYGGGDEQGHVRFERSVNVTGAMGRAGEKLEVIFISPYNSEDGTAPLVVMDQDVFVKQMTLAGEAGYDGQGKLSYGGVIFKKNLHGNVLLMEGGAVAFDSTENDNLVDGEIVSPLKGVGTILLQNESIDNADGNKTTFINEIRGCAEADPGPPITCVSYMPIGAVRVSGSAHGVFEKDLMAENILFAGSNNAAKIEFEDNANLVGNVVVVQDNYGHMVYNGQHTATGGVIVDEGTLRFSLNNAPVKFEGDEAVDINGNFQATAQGAGASLEMQTSNTIKIDGDFKTDMLGGGLTLEAGKGITIGGRKNTDITLSDPLTLGSNMTVGSGLATTTTVVGAITADYDPRTGTPVIDAQGNRIARGSNRTALRFKLDPGTSTLNEGDTVTFISGADSSSKIADAFKSGYYGFVDDGTVSYVPVLLDDGNVEARVTYMDLADGTKGLERIIMKVYDAKGDLFAVRNRLIMAQNQGEKDRVLNAVRPVVDDVARLNYQAAVQSVNIARGRMAALRDPDYNGIAAGEVMANGLGAWSQGYGQKVSQGSRQGRAGYDANSYGLAVGVDSADIMDDVILGAAFSYTRTNMKSDGANHTKAHINSYQLSAYGSYELPKDAYVSGVVGYARNRADQTRFRVGTIEGLDIGSQSNSSQYVLYGEAGKSFDFTQGIKVTPHVLAHYQYLLMSRYSERDSTLGLDVAESNSKVLEFGAGLNVAKEFRFPNYSTLSPSAHVSYRRDVLADNVQTSARFIGGGGAFVTDGMSPARGTLNAGIGLNYTLEGVFEIDAFYDFESKASYSAHAGIIRAAKKF